MSRKWDLETLVWVVVGIVLGMILTWFSVQVWLVVRTYCGGQG